MYLSSANRTFENIIKWDLINLSKLISYKVCFLTIKEFSFKLVAEIHMKYTQIFGKKISNILNNQCQK